MNWLLLRGLAREQRHWHGFGDLFGARAVGEPVLLVDVAGVGTQHQRWTHPSIEWMARDVARRLPGWSPRSETSASWSIIGLSLGGMIALELCRLYPERIRNAVIVNASSRLTSWPERLRPGAARELARASLSPDPVHRERLVLELTSALPEPERARYAVRAAEFARDAPTSRWSVLAQLLAAARFVPPARAALTARLLFVCARSDALVSPRCTRELAAWYGVESQEHPWAGHDLPLDDPGWLCERILQFAAENELRPRESTV
jgi:pimeloyl-[acyl-carrier protein] methyl ester esterase